MVLMSACYFTACDDDASSVAASFSDQDSSSSIAKETKEDKSSSSEAKAESSSSAEAKKENSSSSIKAEAKCEIEKDSDTYAFAVEGNYNGSAVSINVANTYGENLITRNIGFTLALGSAEDCQTMLNLYKKDEEKDDSEIKVIEKVEQREDFDISELETITSEELKPTDGIDFFKFRCDNEGNFIVAATIPSKADASQKENDYKEVTAFCAQINEGKTDVVITELMDELLGENDGEEDEEEDEEEDDVPAAE